MISSTSFPGRLSTLINRQRGMQIAIAILWLGVTCGGLAALTIYANSAGPSLAAPESFPRDSRLALAKQGPTLLLFVHPHCPCTRATLGELEKIVACHPQDLTVSVVFFQPAGTTPSWLKTDLWATASAIPGVHVISDPDGIEAKRFRVTTSGAALLYNQQGQRLFNGGITLARGHAGDNPGQAAIKTLLTGESAPVEQTPVFGCPITNLTEQKQEVQ